MFFNIKTEEYIEPDLSGTFWVKMIAKNMALGPLGTHFMHMRVNSFYYYRLLKVKYCFIYTTFIFCFCDTFIFMFILFMLYFHKAVYQTNVI